MGKNFEDIYPRDITIKYHNILNIIIKRQGCLKQPPFVRKTLRKSRLRRDLHLGDFAQLAFALLLPRRCAVVKVELWGDQWGYYIRIILK